METGQYQLLLRLNNQDDVNRCVDDLRQQGVSLIGLNRKKITLEDAFINLISESPVDAQLAEAAD